VSTKIVSIILLPILIWMLALGSKKITGKYKVGKIGEFYFEIYFLFILLFGIVSLFAYLVFGKFLVITLSQPS